MRTRRLRDGGASGEKRLGGAVGLWRGDHPMLVVLALNLAAAEGKPQPANENGFQRFIAGASVFSIASAAATATLMPSIWAEKHCER
jgi:hypothetical protein